MRQKDPAPCEEPFQGGSVNLPKGDYVEIVASTLNTSALTDARGDFRDEIENEILSNRVFWQKIAVGDLSFPEKVRFRNFAVSEWLPAFPGRYFTPHAASLRRAARAMHRAGGWRPEEEFRPSGKINMILGGIGTIRLAPREIMHRDVVWMGATSDGICHRGIPLIVPMDIAERIQPRLHRKGALVCNFSGNVWVISDRSLPIKFDNGVPKVFVYCDKIHVVADVTAGELLATAAVSFSVHNQWIRHLPNGAERKGWTFKSFDPVGGRVELDRTVQWMQEYVERYGLNAKRSRPLVFSDFDEIISHFDCVEFPLSKLMARDVDPATLLKYVKECNLIINGDVSMVKNVNYEVSGGQVGAFGEGANVNIVQQQQVLDNSNLNALALELENLRQALLKEATEPRHYETVGQIVRAQKAAQSGDKNKVLQTLSKAGKWALDTATSIGADIAAALIKSGLGM